MDGIAGVQARIQDIISQFEGPPPAATDDTSDASSSSSASTTDGTDFASALAQAQSTGTTSATVPASTGTLNRAGVDSVQWAKDFLTQLGAPLPASNVQAITAWEQAEGTKASYNPLATTQGGFAGETQFNSVGVKNYASYQDGLAANVKVITNGLLRQHPRRAPAGQQRDGGGPGDRELPVGNRHRRGARPRLPAAIDSVESVTLTSGRSGPVRRRPIPPSGYEDSEVGALDVSPSLACAIVACSADGLVIVDPDGTLRYREPRGRAHARIRARRDLRPRRLRAGAPR